MSQSDYNRTQKGKQSPGETKARYIAQLQNMLQTAERMNNRRVIFALSRLLHKRGGE